MNKPLHLSIIATFTLTLITAHAKSTTSKESKNSDVSYLPNAAWYIAKNAPKETEQKDKPTPSTLQEKIMAMQEDLAVVSEELKSSLLALAAKPDGLTNDAYKTCTRAKEKMEKIQKRAEGFATQLTASVDAIDKTIISTDDKAELKASMSRLTKICNETAASAHAQIDCLKDSDSQIGLWKETYKYYLNLVGEQEANQKLKSVISASLSKLDNPNGAGAIQTGSFPSKVDNTTTNTNK